MATHLANVESRAVRTPSDCADIFSLLAPDEQGFLRRGRHNPNVKHIESAAHARLLDELMQVRAAAIEHTRVAQELARKRRRLIDPLLAEGFSQTDLARELRVTRQAIQKMVAVGQDGSRR